jgi:hypothetical protein
LFISFWRFFFPFINRNLEKFAQFPLYKYIFACYYCPLNLIFCLKRISISKRNSNHEKKKKKKSYLSKGNKEKKMLFIFHF